MDLSRRLPPTLLVVGLIALGAGIPLSVRYGDPLVELPWVAGTAVFLAASAYVWRRQPERTIARWFAATGGLVAIVQTTHPLMDMFLELGDEIGLAWAVFGFQVTLVLTVVTLAHLLGLFPDGRIERTYERRVLRAAWAILLLPPLVLIGNPTLQVPPYIVAPEVANPYHVSALTGVGEVAGLGMLLGQGVFAVGVVLLLLRYRRADRPLRRRIRWLLLPTIFAAGVAIFDLLLWRAFPAGPPGLGAYIAVTALWIAVIASIPLAITVALLRPDLLDIDRIIRKSLVYGLLWVLIAGVYVVAAAGLGVAAGQRFSVGVAIVLTVVATLLFQPARQRLERLADRWVFGARTDPAQLVARLGETLAGTFDLDTLLPRMAATLEEGLGLRWARVRLEPHAGEHPEPVLVVPIVLGEETLGHVECGPKTSGAFTEEDEAVVTTLAQQAALAVRNVRLTKALAAQAEQLAASRASLVRAQESERRRIERNIHDGAQQDLIALVGHAAHTKSLLERDPAAGAAALEELQVGLRRTITDLRELARGIHPSLLSDRGLLEAVEALAARSAVPIAVRADPALRGARFPAEVEGAAYFTVAEALANVAKHAGAGQAEVRLARSDRLLRIEVSDDGTGFDPASTNGGGLANLAARVAAVGGRLEIDSGPSAGTRVIASLATTAPELAGD